MNTLHLKNVEYVWVNGKECGANHDDLFCWEGIKINIFSLKEEILSSYLETTPPEYNMKGFFWFQGMHDNRVLYAQDFLKCLKPSKKVSEAYDCTKKYEIGYAVRLLHPKSIKPKKELIFSYKSFLTSDSQKFLDSNPWCYQNHYQKGNSDLDKRLRDIDGQIHAVADWFTLMNCKEVYTYGTPASKDRPLGLSTFTDAILILNIKSKNISA